MERNSLISAAKELNKILGLEPQIDLEQEDENLVVQILEAADLVTKQDKISDQTKKAIETLQSGDDTPGKEPDEPPTEEGTEVGEETLAEQVENAERLKDLKEIAKANTEFKSIRGKLNGFKDVDELRDTMLDLLETEEEPEEEEEKVKPVQQKPAPKPVIEKRSAPAKRSVEKISTRLSFICQTLKSAESLTTKEIATLADTKYSAVGGKSNFKQSIRFARILLLAAIEWGIVVVKDGKISSK